MYRQGDLLIVPEPNALPNHVTADTSRVVQEGEATGHAHRIENGGAVYGNGNWVRSDGTTELVHDEHDTILLPEGLYRVLRQREYSEDGGWSNVWD